jgi:hypothetical protein
VFTMRKASAQGYNMCTTDICAWIWLAQHAHIMYRDPPLDTLAHIKTILLVR